MDVSYLLDSLNDTNSAKRWPRHAKQHAGVGGRGSGKTRAGAPYAPVTERRKQLAIPIMVQDLLPIKRRREMRHRIGQLMGTSRRNVGRRSTVWRTARCARIIWTLICRRISRFSTAKIDAFA